MSADSVARRLLAAGYSVRGLVCNASKTDQLTTLGITPVVGGLDDHDLLVSEARAADGDGDGDGGQ